LPIWAQAIIAAFGALPGIGAAIGAFFWFGRLSARLDAVEHELTDLKDIGREVATIAERTKNTADTVNGIGTDVRAVTRHLLDEGRVFARQLVRDHQGAN
jgi:hypothetical protein